MACCLIAVLFSYVAETHAQFDSLGLNTPWNNGTLVLDDNTTLKGSIQFNDKMGLIKYRKNPDDEERSFVETSISAMRIYDEEAARWRNFAVFNVNHVQTGTMNTMLFEVLMEFSNFALLTRVDRVNVGVRHRQDMYGNFHTVRVGYEQFEHLCLVDEGGTAHVVLSVSEFERNKFAMASKLKPILDKKSMEKYLGDDWDKFQDLVKSNKLNLRKRDDFVRAFEIYQEEFD